MKRLLASLLLLGCMLNLSSQDKQYDELQEQNKLAFQLCELSAIDQHIRNPKLLKLPNMLTQTIPLPTSIFRPYHN